MAVIAALQDPVRARLYSFIAHQVRPVTREAAATAAGISAKLAAFHLDKLVTAGLLTAGDARPRPRRPGRAPKVYALSAGEWEVSVPPRRYPLLADILVAALADLGEPARAAAGLAAADTGRRLGQRTRAERRLGRLGPERALTVTAEVLEDGGYEPRRQAAGLALRNCPFAQLAASAPELVCSLNDQLITGLLDGLGAQPALRTTVVRPENGCCVQIHTAASRPSGTENTDVA